VDYLSNCGDKMSKKKPSKFKCMVCDEEPFEHEGDLAMHILWGHGYAEEVIVDGVTKYRCTICDEIFDIESDLEMDVMWTHGLAVEIPEEQQ